MLARMAMMAITTNNSIKVKAKSLGHLLAFMGQKMVGFAQEREGIGTGGWIPGTNGCKPGLVLCT